MEKIVWLLGLYLVSQAAGLTNNPIDPSNYIWIRYKEQVPIQLNA